VPEAGISDVTFYRWKAKYGGLEVNDARRLRTLEEVKQLILERRKDKPGLRKLEVFVYLDSPAQDNPPVARLLGWARDLDPQRGKLMVELREPDRNAPVD